MEPRSTSRVHFWFACVAAAVVTAVAVAVFEPLLGAKRTPPSRPTCVSNLKQIGLALHNYHDTYGCFPPAVLRGPGGEPWHSWRVLILPYVEARDLYEAYDFSQPWSSPKNLRLLAKMPEVYRCEKVRGVCTPYLAVRGDDTAWPDEPITLDDFAGGVGNALSVIELTHRALPWTRAEDISAEALADHMRVPQDFPEPVTANALFADGAVWCLKLEDLDGELRGALERAKSQPLASELFVECTTHPGRLSPPGPRSAGRLTPEDFVGLWHVRSQADWQGEPVARTDFFFIRDDGNWTQLTAIGTPPCPWLHSIEGGGKWSLADGRLDLRTEPFNAQFEGQPVRVKSAGRGDTVVCYAPRHFVLVRDDNQDTAKVLVFFRGAGPWEGKVDELLRQLGPRAWKACKQEPYPPPSWTDWLEGLF